MIFNALSKYLVDPDHISLKYNFSLYQKHKVPKAFQTTEHKIISNEPWLQLDTSKYNDFDV